MIENILDTEKRAAGAMRADGPSSTPLVLIGAAGIITAIYLLAPLSIISDEEEAADKAKFDKARSDAIHAMGKRLIIKAIFDPLHIGDLLGEIF